MILDELDNADRYLTINKGFRNGFAFLMRSELERLAPGRHEIQTDRVYAIVEDSPGRNRREAELEAHEKYIDIQLVVAGTDSIGWRRKADCKRVSRAYDANKDYQFFEDEPELWLPVQAGMFAIFFPEDAHMPSISQAPLRKVVVKVAIDQ